MNISKNITILCIIYIIAVMCVYPAIAETIETAFTYQGRLIDANQPANGLYDFQFKLFDAETDGNQVGLDVNLPEVDVIDGYFTVELDFGSAFDGDDRWIEIGVRPGNFSDPNIYTVLSPRQKVTPTPYALQIRGMFVDNAGNIGIGTMNPEAKLDVVSVTSGFLPPRMTTAQINAITSPPEGMMVYDATTHRWIGYNGTAWVCMGGGESKLATGTYTGNGMDNRSITGIGFQPDIVFVWQQGHREIDAVVSTDADPADQSKHLGRTPTNSANFIQDFEADGFQIGSNDTVNENGKSFTYIAIKK